MTENKRIEYTLIFDINEEMYFGFVKIFSCLLDKFLGIDINNIKLNKYIKEYSKTIELKTNKI